METANHTELKVLRVRCPSCLKLYSVDTAEIFESKPQFACSKCQTQFWFPFSASLESDEIVGFPKDWLGRSELPKAAPTPTLDEVQREGNSTDSAAQATTTTMYHCPRCQAEYRAGDSECPKCGVVFAKLDFVDDPKSVPASPQLRRQWHSVMEQYANLETHRKFVNAAQRENNLVYASHQYARLLRAHAGDDMALKMQKEILALSQVTSGLTSKGATAPKTKLAFKILPRMATIFLITGGSMIGFGFLAQSSRNLIGLGVAIVFFTLAVDWLFARND